MVIPLGIGALFRINSIAKSIWNNMRNKEYRDSYACGYTLGIIQSQIFTMRKSRGWTQNVLGERAGMKQTRISELEDPDLENVEVATLQRIASAFDVALLVKFVPFSEIAVQAANLSPTDYNVIEFSKDSLKF